MNIEKKALFSVSPFEGLAEMAKRLSDGGWGIIATTDACKVLRNAGLDVMDVADFNGVSESFGFPPTLHAKMEHALTVDSPDRIDLVFDIPYGLSKGNDVGGLALLALAAKGGRIPVMSVEDMEEVVTLLCSEKGVSKSHKRRLISKTNFAIARHYLELVRGQGDNQYFGAHLEVCRLLAGGENPYQSPAYLCNSGDADPLGLPRFDQANDNIPCFTNLADLDCILETLCRLHVACENNLDKSPYLVVAAKHGNPCGMGSSWQSREEAVDRALWGNPLAIWGGEVIVNFPLDEDLAGTLLKSKRRGKLSGNEYWMLDVVVAPAMDSASVKILSKKTNRKLFENHLLLSPTLSDGIQLRHVRGGALVQPPANYVIDLDSLSWCGGAVPPDRKLDLLMAWATVFTSNLGGNEVALVKDGRLLAVGGGPSTIEAARQAVIIGQYSGHDLSGAAFAADAFFPFTDAPEVLCKAGVTTGVVPGGGKRHQEIVQYFVSHQANVGFLPEVFRGFCRH